MRANVAAQGRFPPFTRPQAFAAMLARARRPDMTDTGTERYRRRGPQAWVVIAVLCWAATAAVMLLTGFAQVGQAFPDTDDAMRLAEIRDFLAGQGWFDVTQARLDPPGVVMHWSRLVDLPMALMIEALTPLAGPAGAERITMALWPPLTLLPAMLGLAFAAREIGGTAAAIAGAVMAATCIAVHPLFAPGRIDHHNVQIASTMILVASTLAAVRAPRAAIVAGLSAAFMLAVGMETLAYVGIAAAVFALRVAGEGAPARDAAVRFGLALSLGTALLFVVTVPVSRWTVPVCDALGPNIAALAVLGGAGLAAAARILPAAAGPAARWGGVATAGIAALAAFAAMDPACLKGPYGAIDPRIVPIWLESIPEAQSWRSFAAENGSGGLLVLAFPLLGMACGALLWRSGAVPRPRLAAALAFLAAAIAIALVQVRSTGYANALAIPLVAAWVAGWAAAIGEPAARRARLALGVLLANPLSVGLLAAVAAEAALPSAPPTGGSLGGAACARPAAYATLAREPKGFVAAYTELGAFVLASSPHAVLSGPYHRNVAGIVDTYALFTAPDAQARDIARRRAIDLVVTCATSKDLDLLRQAAPDGLAARLARGETPDWLAPVPSDGGPIGVWRVRE
jgi:hypothetical protein